MGYRDALLAARFLGTKKVIGVHFDTFPWIQIDHKEVMLTAEFNEIDLVLPAVGQVIEI
jgi:L-ascorbate metabolism protein UlaG (beta-lactamase superfamily)